MNRHIDKFYRLMLLLAHQTGSLVNINELSNTLKYFSENAPEFAIACAGSLLWIINAGLAYKIFCVLKPAFPLSAYDDLTAFKIYLPDVGLLRRLSLLDTVAIVEGNRLFTEFKGALTENFVLSGLLQQFEGIPRYWRSGMDPSSTIHHSLLTTHFFLFTSYSISFSQISLSFSRSCFFIFFFSLIADILI